jgi:CheY-like chemotaxis protein
MSQLPPVMLVDDNDDDLFILQRLLGKCGLQNKTVTFQDGRVALGYLEAECRVGEDLLLPIVIFSDLHMPEFDGFSFVQGVRAQPRLRDKRVIVVSSSESRLERERVLALGANDFLLKYPTVANLQPLLRSAGCTLK